MAKKQNIAFEKSILQDLKELLVSLPGVSLLDFAEQSLGQDSGYDAHARIRIRNKKNADLYIQVKSSVYPRDLHQLAQKLKGAYRSGEKHEALSLIAASALSPGSRKLLREEEIGYFDAGGSIFLPLADSIFYIDRTPPETERTLKNIYKGRSAQVLHVLLANPSRKWHINEVAEQAEVSSYTAHQVFTKLEEQLLLEKSGKGPDSVRVLKNPGALLDTWVENYSLDQYTFKSYYKWSKKITDLRKDIAENLSSRNIEYALALNSGADLVAPFTSGASEKLYVIVPDSEKLAEVVEDSDLEPVDDGANITLMVTSARTPFLNRQMQGDCWVASDIQLYLDLSKWRARGKEQAEHLRRQRLKF